MPCVVVWHGVALWCVLLHGMVLCCVLLCGVVWQFSHLGVVQRCGMLFVVLRLCSVLSIDLWCGVVCCGVLLVVLGVVVCYGVVLCVVVWYVVVLCFVVSYCVLCCVWHCVAIFTF